MHLTTEHTEHTEATWIITFVMQLESRCGRWRRGECMLSQDRKLHVKTLFIRKKLSVNCDLPSTNC
jgi:hypothetical protein